MPQLYNNLLAILIIMGRLQTKVAECEYREYDRLLTEKFIGGHNDEGMTDEMLREVATSEHILTWVHRVVVQRAQRSAFNSIKEAKELDAIWQNTQKHTCETSCSDKCKYCGTGHASQQCPTFWRKCRECGKVNHFKVVWGS